MTERTKSRFKTRENGKWWPADELPEGAEKKHSGAEYRYFFFFFCNSERSEKFILVFLYDVIFFLSICERFFHRKSCSNQELTSEHLCSIFFFFVVGILEKYFFFLNYFLVVFLTMEKTLKNTEVLTQ